MSHRLKTVFAIGGLITLLMTSQARAGLDGNPFEGTYLGFSANYSKVSGNATYELLDSDISTFNGISSSSDSAGYGGILYGGIGTSLWGPLYGSVEGGLGLTGGTGSISDDAAELGLKAGFTFEVNTRLGVTVSDNILIYGLGGYTSVKFSGQGFANGGGSSLAGYRVGAGFEVGVMEDIALRVEYIRTEHSSTTIIQGGDSFRFDPSTQVIRIGLVLHME